MISEQDERGTASQAAWFLLCATLLITPLLTPNLAVLSLEPRALLYGGSPMLKSAVSGTLVFGALACFSVALARGTQHLRWHPVLMLVAGFVCWAALATALSVSPGTALLGAPTRHEGLIVLFGYAAVLFLAVQLVDDSRRMKTLLLCAVVGGVLSAAYGLMQAMGVEVIQSGVPEWGARRASAAIGNTDMFGAFAAAIGFVAAGAAASASSTRSRMALAAISGLSAGAAFLSYSRGAWIALVVGAVAFAVIGTAALRRVGWRSLAACTVVFALTAGAGVFSAGPRTPDTQVVRRIVSAGDANDANVRARLETWKAALSAVRERPLMGFGPDTFALAYEPHKTARMAASLDPKFVQDNAHNVFLQTASDLGLIGVAAFMCLLAWIAWISARVSRASGQSAGGALMAGVWAGTAAYLAALQFAPGSVSGSVLLWAMLGVLLAPSAMTVGPAELSSSGASGEAIKRMGTRRLVAGVALTVAAVALLSALALQLVADAKAAVAQQRERTIAERLEAADTAVLLVPMGAQYHAVRAVAYMDAFVYDTQSEGVDPAAARYNFDESIASARRSAALEPTSSRKRSQVATLLLVGGDRMGGSLYDDAVREASRAMKLAPRDLSAKYVYARALAKAGRLETAENVLRSVLRVRPSYVQAALLQATIKKAGGDEAGARSVLDKTGLAESDPQIAEALRTLEAE